jgi:hypothetical protein
VSGAEAEPLAPGADAPPLEAHFAIPEPIDLRASLEPFRHGTNDPTIRFGRDGV